jgi:hypothetical protein
MHLEIIVEEPSAETALRALLPRLLRPGDDFSIIAYRGKTQMFQSLARDLGRYKGYMPPGRRVLVLVDRDRDDCRQLKRQLETFAAQAGLRTKTHPAADGTFQVVTRIAIEELEAWFLGDPAAVQRGFRRVKAAHFKGCEDPDAIAGGTAEKLGRILHAAGEISSPKLPKGEAASRIAPHLNPDTNASASFRHFCGAVRACFGADAER